MRAELRGATFVAVGVLLGMTLANLWASPPQQAPAPGGGSGTDPELVDAIVRLCEAMESRTQSAPGAAGATLTGSPQPRRESAGPTANGEIATLLERVLARIERLEQLPGSTSGAAHYDAQVPSLEVKPADTTLTSDIAARIQGGELETVRSEWVLRSRSDVLKQFGKPSYIQTREHGSERWGYMTGPGRSVVIEINRSGYVANIYD